MNIKTRILSKEEYEKVIETIEYGFELDGKKIRPNHRMATLCVVQACTGLRIGDLLRLRLKDIVREDGRYHFQIVEEKTKKERNFIIAPEVYTYIQTYALDRGIGRDRRLFEIGSRAVNKHLQMVSKYLGIDRLGSHSMRKYFASSIYSATKNAEIVRVLLNHSNINITQHYIGVSPQIVEKALLDHVCIPELHKAS